MKLPPDVIEAMAQAFVYGFHPKSPAKNTSECMQAALDALGEAGWAVVPREPTEVMCKAPQCLFEGEGPTTEQFIDIYQAMLKAAEESGE